MTVGLLSPRGVAIADVHPWQDVVERRVITPVQTGSGYQAYGQVATRRYVRASPQFFVESTTGSESKRGTNGQERR